MALSQAALVNLAFGNIGHNTRIVSVQSDQSTEAAIARAYFDGVSEFVQGDFDWDFNRSMFTLTLIPNVTYEGWSYTYAVPAQAVIPRRLLRDNKDDSHIPYKLMRDGDNDGRRLLFTDRADAVLVASVVERDLSKWPPKYNEAFTWLLGHYFGPAIGASPERMSYAYKRYQGMVEKAEIVSANSEMEEPAREAEHILAR